MKLLQKDQETTNEKRKEKKRESKEKNERRGKEHRSKDKSESSKHREHGHKKRKYVEINELKLKEGSYDAATKDVEQLEKSGITEEHGLPVCMQEPCESSESTQNSSKSRKLEASSIGGSGHGKKPIKESAQAQQSSKSWKLEASNISSASHGGTILRLRLPLLKKDPKPAPVNIVPCSSVLGTPKDLEATLANEEPGFSGRVTGAPLEPVLDDNALSHSNATNSKIVTEVPVDRELSDNAHNASSSSSKGSRRARKLEKKFRDLVMNWKPAPFLLDADPGTEDLGWLFERSQQHRASSDVKSGSVSTKVEDLSHGSGMSLQPRACYLPELDMYQLPYVVPF